MYTENPEHEVSLECDTCRFKNRRLNEWPCAMCDQHHIKRNRASVIKQCKNNVPEGAANA